MQQATHRANAPHPELQAELQQEYARIVPKVERSTITKAESNASQNLKWQANGHAQPTGTIRRRQLSPRSDSSNISPRATRQHGDLRRDSGLESLEHIKDGMVESQAALALLSLSERHSPGSYGSISPNYVNSCGTLDEAADTNHAPTGIDDGGPRKAAPGRDGSISPNLLEDHQCRSLSNATNFAMGSGGHHIALPQAENHSPTGVNDGRPEIVHGLRRRKDSQSVT